MGFEKLHVRTIPIVYGILTAYILVYHRVKLHAFIQRIIYSLSLCLLLLLADAQRGMAIKAIVKFLSSPILRPFGPLSYSTYMLHPIVITIGFMFYLPSHPAITATEYFQFGLWMILVVYFLATLSFLFIEQPSMRFIKQRLQAKRSELVTAE